MCHEKFDKKKFVRVRKGIKMALDAFKKSKTMIKSNSSRRNHHKTKQVESSATRIASKVKKQQAENNATVKVAEGVPSNETTP